MTTLSVDKIKMFVIFVIFTNSILAESNIRIITENYKPLSYLQEGKLIGPSVEILQLLMKKLKVQSSILIFPWLRGYLTTRDEPNTALFSTTRTKERESLFKWVGPLSQKEFSIFALKKSNIKINNIDEIEKYLTGVERGSINEQLLLSRGILNLSRVDYPKQNLNMLLWNRIELWSVSSSTFYETLLEQNINPQDIEKIYTIKHAKLFIAFNKETPDNIIKSWQSAFDELHFNGTIKEIFDKYNLSHLYVD